MTALSRAWRLLAVLGGIVVLVLAQLQDTSEWFPLTSMAQFAQARDPNGTVVNTCLRGTEQGSDTPVEIPFGLGTVGVQRSDVEGNLSAIQAHPERLAPLAATWDANHPGRPPLATLSVCQEIVHLRDGGPDGRVDERILVTWEAE